MFCCQCNRKIKSNGKYCKYCGAEQQEFSAISDFSADKYKVRWQLPIGGKTIVIFVIVVVIGLLLYVMSHKNFCNWCEKYYLGEAYYNAINQEDIMCEECAQIYYGEIDYTQFCVEQE